jgi:phospholipase C
MASTCNLGGNITIHQKRRLVPRCWSRSQCKDAAIIITYDENGGFWDHVAPPAVDRCGPGTRFPSIIISPFSKHGYVDHTQYETVSILSFIEKRWGLQPLTDRDKNANPLLNSFNF